MMGLNVGLLKLLVLCGLFLANVVAASVPDGTDALPAPELIFAMPIDVTLESKEKVTLNLKLRAG